MKATLFTRITGQVLLPLLLLTGCSSEIDDKGLTPVSGFTLKDELLCTIARSSSKGDVGMKITLTGLKRAQVKVIFESGTRSPMKKIYEDNGTIVVQLIASTTGSIDTFVIDKTTGKFSRATAGSFAGLYASASVGVCI